MNESTMSVNRKAMAVPLILLLVFALAGTALLNTPISAKAEGKVKMWVVKKENVTLTLAGDDDYPCKGSYTYSYNKYGLLNKCSGDIFTGDFAIDGYFVQTYSYDSKQRLKSCVWKEYTKKGGRLVSNTKAKSKLNTKGYVTRLGKTKYSYDKKGRLVKATYEDGSYNKYTYLKNGKVKSMKVCDSWESATEKFSYDSKGNVSAQSGTRVKNTYKSGRLKTWVCYNSLDDKKASSFTYKKVSVPKSLVKMVKAQQTSIITDSDYSYSGSFINGILPIEAAHK